MMILKGNYDHFHSCIFKESVIKFKYESKFFKKPLKADKWQILYFRANSTCCAEEFGCTFISFMMFMETHLLYDNVRCMFMAKAFTAKLGVIQSQGKGVLCQKWLY